MYNEKIKSTLDQADQFLENAQIEMYRSKEDVVPHAACSNARQSFTQYLTGFLLKNGVEDIREMSLIALLKKCEEINPKFKNLNMDTMYCSNETHDANFCTHLGKVKECVQLATQAKKLVEDEPWPLSINTK
ncbi:MAG: HEPN domain-containing protein [Saprospiraceae bacterium]|jgi:HEPN domain-containing protein